MLEHALKLIWNRRRANARVVVEIAGAFVGAFVILALAVHYWTEYRRPLGFGYENVWQVRVEIDGAAASDRAARVRDLRDVLAALRSLPRIEAAHAIHLTPFAGGRVWAPFGAGPDRVIDTHRNIMTGGAPEALGVELVEGRWFGPEDEGRPYFAVLVNRKFVEDAFGPGVSVLGKNVSFPPPELAAAAPEAAREARVVGIIESFRQQGELSPEVPFAIVRYDLENDATTAPLRGLFVKVAPGTEAAYEQTIAETVAAIAPDWALSFTPWAELRARRIDATLMPLKAGATLGAFMLLMVAMGLTGVLSQDAARRTREIGLRRAIGARAVHVSGQLVLEALAVAALGVAAGAAAAVQFPLLGLVEQIDWAAASWGMLLSAALMLGLTALSASYPSRLAARREPTHALRHE